MVIQILFSILLADGIFWKNLIICIVIFGMPIFVLISSYEENITRKKFGKICN
ncbi:MAG: hypothetical protein LKM44_03415 [Wolbachia endosymbiont of Meromenopon meropis]|nr:hypothetical protein [Wolbachia endosymbiont of Meromenopon meropis]